MGVRVTADKYLALDVNSGEVLLENNSTTRQALASITKLMTALVIIDQNPNWQELIIMDEIDETQGAKPHLYRGETMKFIDVWKTALIGSDNNAIMAMVRSLGFSRTEFVSLMNEKAQELKLYNTTFDDPTGLSPQNEGTASDVAKLLFAALQRNEIRESVLQAKYTFPIINSNKTRTIINTDILINSFLNNERYGYELVGGKTGALPEAGYCLTVELKNQNHPVIIVVLNSETIDDRFQDTKVLADWVFSNYQWK